MSARSRVGVALAPLLAFALAGCSGSLDLAGTGSDATADETAGEGLDSRESDDAGVELGSDGHSDGTREGDDGPEARGDADVESPPWDADLPSPFEVPQCGNGVLDEGEECDDRNRLNGDGCDWLCRVGDGEPPPEPDPDEDDYIPVGPPMPVDGAPPVGGWSLDKIPLVWTGENYATAWWTLPEDDAALPAIHFQRFDSAAVPVGEQWTIEGASLQEGPDLVWTGAEYALFYTDRAQGIFLVRFDKSGDLVAAPRLIEPDPQARCPAASRSGDAFVMAWVVEGCTDGCHLSWCGGWGEPADVVRVEYLAADGTPMGTAVTVDGFAAGPPDLAIGDDGGIGLALPFNSSPAHAACSFRFVRLTPDLAEATFSGFLSDGVWGDVDWAYGQYAVAWSLYDTMSGGRTGMCLGRFAPDGTLEAPPVCTDLSPFGIAEMYTTRLAAGDGGFGLVASSDSDTRLSFLRTDAVGSALGPLRPVWTPDGGFGNFGPFNIAWGGDVFGVVFGMQSAGPWFSDVLSLQLFAPAP
jgi:cysteine-rich repeat protein